RDAEEGAVELFDVFEESACGLRSLAGLVADPSVVIPALRRDRRHGIARFREQAPERAAVGCASGESASQTDNGNGIPHAQTHSPAIAKFGCSSSRLVEPA